MDSGGERQCGNREWGSGPKGLGLEVAWMQHKACGTRRCAWRGSCGIVSKGSLFQETPWPGQVWLSTSTHIWGPLPMGAAGQAHKKIVPWVDRYTSLSGLLKLQSSRWGRGARALYQASQQHGMWGLKLILAKRKESVLLPQGSRTGHAYCSRKNTRRCLKSWVSCH